MYTTPGFFLKGKDKYGVKLEFCAVTCNHGQNPWARTNRPLDMDDEVEAVPV